MKLKPLFIQIFFISLISVFSISLNAQDDLEIITFDDNNKKSNSREAYVNQLVVKSNLISFLYGRQFIEAEYMLTDYLTIEGGLGLTFSPALNGYESLYSEIFFGIIGDTDCSSPNYEDQFNYCDQSDYNDFNIRNSGIGPWLSGAVKFYLFNDALDGTYIGLNLKYHRNNYQILTVEETLNFVRSESNYVSESVNNLDYTVRIGSQTVFEPLVTDIFVGVGIRNVNQNRLDVGFDTGRDVWTNSYQQLQSSTFIAELGIRLGFVVNKKVSSKSKKKKKKRRR